MKKIIPLVIHRRLFVYLFLGFITATVIGTLSHECGHYLMARYYGYKYARISYAYTRYTLPDKPLRPQDSLIRTIYLTYKGEIESSKPFLLKGRYDDQMKQYKREALIMRAAGPVETMLTGTAGLMLLLIARKSLQRTERLNFRQWICVFLALFWLREIFNLCTAVCAHLFVKQTISHGDEFILSRQMGFNQWTLPVLLGVVAFALCTYVIFKFVPQRQRLTFIISGFAGGLVGAYLWLVVLGPLLMP